MYRLWGGLIPLFPPINRPPINIIYLVLGLPRARWDSNPRMDPFLPCSSHHFESTLRPMVFRRSAQGTDRSTSSATSGNSTTDTSSPTSPNEVRSFTSRRPGRSRTRYVQESDGIMSGIHPILTWGRQRNNTATTSANNFAQPTVQATSITDALAGQISNFPYVFIFIIIFRMKKIYI